MELWLEKAGPWLEVLERGVRVTVEVVKGRPRLATVVLATSLSSLALYRYVTKNFSRWEKLGIPYEAGRFPAGSINIFSQEKHMFDSLAELYQKHRANRYFGWFMMGQPVLNIVDPELLRIIMVKDFNNFVERSSYDGDMFKQGGKYDKLWGMQLTGAQGEDWKHIRSSFSPIFTSGKMKGMLKFIQMTADNLVKEFDTRASGTEETNMKEVYGKFTADGLAAAAFGMDVNSFEQKDSKFVKYAEGLFKTSLREILLITMKILVPGVGRLFEAFNVDIFKPKETKFFYDVLMSTLRARREGKQERRNDMVDLMMDCLKQDLVEEEEDQDQYEKDMKLKLDKKSKPITEDALVATAMVLLIAGYDTTATTLSYLSYALSKNPQVQEKLQEEVDQAFSDSEGAFPDYSSIQELPYLDMVIHETLRMFSPVGLNTREASSDYTIPGTGVHLKKGDLLSFSVFGLHMDPAHWSHPDEFYPEHFSKEEKATRSPYAYQAFGQGPRGCIGMRFALLEAKVALLAVCRRFQFLPGTTTQEPLKLDPKSQLGWPVGGLWANVKRRDGVL